MVAYVDGLILQVLPVADSDAEELAELADRLHNELLGVDAASVAPLTAEAAPEGAKGLGTLAGWLAPFVPWLLDWSIRRRRAARRPQGGQAAWV